MPGIGRYGEAGRPGRAALRHRRHRGPDGGRALGQARAGGILNVENDSSHRIIRGRLATDGTVEVVN
ncbi:flagella basal body P-ring formation protein FlgA [Thermomonas brevis]|uniref:Flagella basal body P-ring formation protein FlgA n=1 Tax=Thermomonas brevis TaxID=215691 RepID=A0A7G9QXH4_9GAMM|nr:flagella basal body P-ring formation protein FlgA [Thermomonas brevis]